MKAVISRCQKATHSGTPLPNIFMHDMMANPELPNPKFTRVLYRSASKSLWLTAKARYCKTFGSSPKTAVMCLNVHSFRRKVSVVLLIVLRIFLPLLLPLSPLGFCFCLSPYALSPLSCRQSCPHLGDRCPAARTALVHRWFPESCFAWTARL